MSQVNAEMIAAATQVIAPYARHTPLEQSTSLSTLTGAEIWLKMECWQATGSFKIRGAANRLAALTAEERTLGIVTVSAGNHAQGIAACAVAMGIPALIIVPIDASPTKVAALRRYDPQFVELRQMGHGYDEAEMMGIDLARDLGRPFISAYNDPLLIAGQGTIACEMLEDITNLDMILVPVGGGGLASGIATWAKAARPSTSVIGVQSEASPAMHAAIAAGKIVPVTIEPSLADGLAGNIEQGSITVPLCQATLNSIILVTEAQIAHAMHWLAEEQHIIVEGSGAVGVAALLANAVDLSAQRRVGVVLSGRNVTLTTFRETLSTT